MTYSQYVADGAFLLFGLITIIICAKRGFFLTLLKFFKMILSVLAAYLWGGSVAALLGEKFLNASIREGVYNKINGIYLQAADGFSVEKVADVIPEFLKTDALMEKLNGLEGTGAELVNSATDKIAGSLSSVVSGVLGFVLVFLAAFLVLSLLYVIIKGVKGRIRLLGRLDALLGAVLGLALSWVVLLVAGSLMKFFFEGDPVYTQSAVVKFFGESTFLDVMKWLNINEWLDRIREMAI